MGWTVVGIDPSVTATGLADDRCACHLIGRKGITTLPVVDRLKALKDLRNDIINWTCQRAPDLVVIELPAFSRAGGGAMERHWLYLAIVDRLLARGIPVAEVYARTRMAYATGKGAASKTAIVDAVARRFPDYDTGGDDNICDAIILCAMGADHLGEPFAPMPANHRAALAKVAWPNLIGDEA